MLDWDPEKDHSQVSLQVKKKAKRVVKKKKQTEPEGLICINSANLKFQIQMYKPVLHNLWESANNVHKLVESDDDDYAKVVQRFKD